MPRLVAALPGRCTGLIGPWGHLYPHEGRPGPAIGFLAEAIRFFDRALRGLEHGDPALRAFMQERVAPGQVHWERPGRWVAEASWPSPRTRPWRLHLAAEGLCAAPGSAARLRVEPDATLGRAVGPWCSFGDARALTRDQREEDVRSLCFDSAPLEARVEILGAPTLRLELAADRPLAQLAVRLCDVGPDGSSALVCHGVLNLTHGPGHASFAPLVPGERRVVSVRLDDVAHAFPAGHRVRVALHSSLWPMLWPAPEPVVLSVFAGTGWLELPVRPPGAADAGLRDLGAPEGAPGPAVAPVRPGGFRREVATDPGTGEVVTTTRMDLDEDGRPGTWRFDAIDLELGHGFLERTRIRPDDPLSAELEIASASCVARGTWRVEIDTRTRVTASREGFRVEAELRAREGEREVFARRWDERVPRQGL